MISHEANFPWNFNSTHIPELEQQFQLKDLKREDDIHHQHFVTEMLPYFGLTFNDAGYCD